MVIKLKETLHEFWLPVGTLGELWIDGEGFKRFKPLKEPDGYGYPEAGAYLGNIKYKEML